MGKIMNRLISFTNVSLDGFFADSHGEMSWAHKSPQDTEWNEFVAQNASGGGALLFGRATYDMMASFWPTPMAAQMQPVVAERMNSLPKFVVSRTMTQATWSNTTLINGDLVAQIRRLKEQPGKDMAILGSGSLVAQLAAAGLINEFQVVINPIVLGHGKALFAGITKTLPLKLKSSRTFSNGSVVLCYQPG